MWGWSGISSLIMAIVLIVKRDRSPHLKVSVTPTSGPTSSLCLTVKNLGKPSNISAFCEIIGHPNGVNDFRTGEFRIGWEGAIQRKLLNKDESANLLLASFEELITLNQCELMTWQNVEGKPSIFNSARWNKIPKEKLPGFDLKIRIVGDNTKAARTFTCTVRPHSFIGPLEVVNLEEVS